MSADAVVALNGKKFLRNASRWSVAMLAVYAIAAFALFAVSGKVADVYSEIHWWMLPAFMGLALCGFAVRLLRWLALCSSLRSQVPTSALASVYVGGFLMNLTPGRIGELWRAWILHSGWKVGYDRGLSLVFCERFLDLLALLAFATLGLGMATSFTWFAGVAAAFLLLALLVVIVPGWARLLVKGTWGALNKPAPRLFGSALSLCRNVSASLRPRRLAMLLALSCLSWSMEAIAVSLFSGPLGHSIGLRAGAASLGLSNIAGALTHLPGGIGGQEATMSFFLTEAGMTLASAIVLVALMRISTLWFSAALGLPFFLVLTKRHGSWR